MKPIRPRLALLSAAALSGVAALAQTAPAPKSNAAAGEAVQLSAFVVQTDQDKGYAAMNSTSGTRIAMPIKEIPVNISVVTRDFLDDSLAFNFMDTLEYSSGIITRRDDRTAIIIRGFQSGESFVNNFRRIDQQDSSNIERVEIIRGPAAVLYGISYPGGTVNVITKKPVHDRTFGALKGTFGSHSFRRAELDANIPAGKQLAFRLTAAHQYSDGYYAAQNITREHDVDAMNVLTPSLSFRPFTGTQVTVEVEHMRFDKSNPEEILTQSLNGRDTPVAELYGYPLGTTFKGPWLLDYIRNTAVTAILDQKITEQLSARFSAYSVDYDWPRGGLGNFSFVQPNGQAWPDPVTGAPSWRARWGENLYQWNRIYSYRADAVWKFELGATKHQVLAGWQYYEDTNSSRGLQDYVPGTRTVRFHYFPIADKRPVPQRPANLNYEPTNSGSRNRDENSQVYAVHTGKWFNDKLVTLVGLFKIDIDNVNRGANAADNTRPPAQHAFLPPAVFRNDSVSPQLGLLYQPNDRYSLYTLYSESVEPVETGRNDKDGNPLLPVYAEGIEAGVKLDLTRKLVGTIGLYHQEIQNSVAFNDLLPNPFNPTADPNISPRGAYEQVGQRLNEGLSVDLVWSPTPQIQARAGWQHTIKNEITGDTNKAIVGRYFGRYIRDFVTFYGRYEFERTSRWAGVSFNAGLQWRDKQLRGYPGFAGGAPTWQKGYWNSDVAARYSGKFGRYAYTVAVNGKNLLRQPAVIGYRQNSVVPYYYKSDPEVYFTFTLKH